MHTRDYSTRYKPTSDLPLWSHPLMNPVRWESLVGTPYWEEYLKVKHERIDQMLADAEESFGKKDDRPSNSWKTDEELQQAVVKYWREHGGKQMDQAYASLHTSPNRIFLVAERAGIWHRDRPPRKRWDVPAATV